MDATRKIITQSDLREAIRKLEDQRVEDTVQLKRQFEVAYESVKPINLIKRTFKEVVTSESLKGDVLNSSIGLAAGLLSKALFVGFSGNPLRKLAGSILMFGVTNLVTKNTSPLRSLGRKALRLVKSKKSPSADMQLQEWDHTR